MELNHRKDENSCLEVSLFLSDQLEEQIISCSAIKTFLLHKQSDCGAADASSSSLDCNQMCSQSCR